MIKNEHARRDKYIFPPQNISHPDRLDLPYFPPSKNFRWINDVHEDRDICVKCGDYQIEYCKMNDILSDTGWLSDNVIDTFTSILQSDYDIRRTRSSSQKQRIMILPTSFMFMLRNQEDFQSVTKMITSRNVMPSSPAMILIPMNVQNQHWKIFCFDMLEKHFILYDSLGKKCIGNKMQLADVEICTYILASLRIADIKWRLYVDQYLQKFKFLDASSIINLQKDGSACGVFLLMLVYSVLVNEGLGTYYSQKHVRSFRLYIFGVLSHYHEVQSKSKHMSANSTKLLPLYTIAKDGINSNVRMITDQETIAQIKYKNKSTTIIDLSTKNVNDNNDDEVTTLNEDDELKKKTTHEIDDDASTVLDSQSVISESKRGKIMVGNTIQKVNVSSISKNVDRIPSGKKPKSKESMGILLAATRSVDNEKDEGSGKKPKSLETLNQQLLVSTQDSDMVLALNDSGVSKAKNEIEGKSDLVDTEKLELVDEDVINWIRSIGSSGRSMRQVSGWNRTSVTFVNLKQYQKHTRTIDAQMRRFTEVRKCQYITFYSTEKRYLVAKNRNAPIKGNENKSSSDGEVYDLVNECIKNLSEKDRDFSKYFLSLQNKEKQNRWHELKSAKKINKAIGSFYQMLLETYARMKKGYSHIKYDSTNKNFHACVFLGDPSNKNIVVDDVVPKQTLLNKQYASHVNAATREPNFYHFLHATSSMMIDHRQQQASLENKHLPLLNCEQGKTNTCYQCGLASALHYLREHQVLMYRKNEMPRYLRRVVPEAIQKETMNLVGKHMIGAVNRILNSNGWRVVNHMKERKKKNQTHIIWSCADKIFRLSGEKFHEIYICNIVNSEGNENHSITITNGLIFDSNFKRAMEFNNDNLNICAGMMVNKATRFVKFRKIMVCSAYNHQNIKKRKRKKGQFES